MQSCQAGGSPSKEKVNSLVEEGADGLRAASDMTAMVVVVSTRVKFKIPVRLMRGISSTCFFAVVNAASVCATSHLCMLSHLASLITTKQQYIDT